MDLFLIFSSTVSANLKINDEKTVVLLCYDDGSLTGSSPEVFFPGFHPLDESSLDNSPAIQRDTIK